jgi:hypothetical protein
LLCGREPGNGLRRLGKAGGDLSPQRLTLVRRDQRLHPPIVRVHAPLDEPARLQPIAQPGEVRGVTAELARQLALRQGRPLAELQQQVRLGRGELELGHDLNEVAQHVLEAHAQQQGRHLVCDGRPGENGVRRCALSLHAAHAPG